MEGHSVLCGITPKSSPLLQGVEDEGSSRVSSSFHRVIPSTSDEDDEEEPEVGGKEEPLVQTQECQICQEEDSMKNLEIPCSCSSSLKAGQQRGFHVTITPRPSQQNIRKQFMF